MFCLAGRILAILAVLLGAVGAPAVADEVAPPLVPQLLTGEDSAAWVAAHRVQAESLHKSAEMPVSDKADARHRFEAMLTALPADETMLPAAYRNARETLLALIQLAAFEFDADADVLSGAPESVRARITQGGLDWRTRAQAVIVALDAADGDGAALSRVLRVQFDRSAPPLILGARTAPVFRPSLPPRAPLRTPSVLPSYAAGGTDPAPTPADLAESSDAPLSDAILGQAAALEHDYLQIIDFVRTGIRTQWYAGAQKGAETTFRTRAGNDVDQASLLIALLRSAQVPARYVRGVVRVPIDDLAAQLVQLARFWSEYHLRHCRDW